MKNFVIINNDSVEFIVEGLTYKKSVKFKHKYIFLIDSRWDELNNYISTYCVENGSKGCFIGIVKDNNNIKYNVWDLSKVFSDVKFIENDISNLKYI